MPTIEDIKRIAEIEFSDIVKSTSLIDFKLRVILINNSAFMEFIKTKLK